MAKAVGTDEIAQLVLSVNRYRVQKTATPQAAKQALQAAGIHTPHGKLKKPYRNTHS